MSLSSMGLPSIRGAWRAACRSAAAARAKGVPARRAWYTNEGEAPDASSRSVVGVDGCVLVCDAFALR
jgi:hypothetical protein